MSSGTAKSLEKRMFFIDTKFALEWRRIVGGHKILANILNVSPQRLNHWINKIKKMPFNKIMMVDTLTGGKVKWFQLSPEILEERSALNDRTGFSMHICKMYEEYFNFKNNADSIFQHFHPFINIKKNNLSTWSL